jgi:TonB family protein
MEGNEEQRMRFMSFRCALVAAVLMGCVAGVRAQSDVESQLRERLVGRSLYLRGAWAGDSLEFDETGKAVGNPLVGPLTLSGVDVKSVRVKGKLMTIHAERVALVLGDKGRLERKAIYSTTLIVPSLRRGDGSKFKASEEMKLVLHSDATGSFDTALRVVFADGKAELATSVPAYWRCYAKGFFAQDVAQDVAQRTVDVCARSQSLPEDDDEGYTPPEMGEVTPQYTREAAEMGVEGLSRVQFVVGTRGLLLHFQIMRAVGAGLDESTIQALAAAHYKAAMKDGVPVAGNMEYRIKYGLAER